MLLLINIKRKFRFLLTAGFLVMLGCESEGDFQFDNLGVSKAGSMAQFYIDPSYLYVVEQTNLSIFDITKEQPLLIAKTKLPWVSETIFKLNDILMIGTTTGVLFYNVSNPQNPTLLSDYAHITSCDPVVSNGQYAFVTLRSGRTCGPAADELQVLDITDISKPKLIGSYPMLSPYGLAIMGNNLFVGEGSFGMRWFDISNILELTKVETIREIEALDFIVNGNNITINTKNSLLQMELTPSNELVKISEMFYADN